LIPDLLVHHPVTDGGRDLAPWQQVFDGRRPRRSLTKFRGE
jgi:hypothetical protein